tara:strand:- start:17113 stop:18444 length:1332 start_codon:yes stop_codon:yes gene_type:complete
MSDTTIPELTEETNPHLDSVIEISEQTNPLVPLSRKMSLAQLKDLIHTSESQVVVVKQASDLIGALSSSKVYVIDGEIDMTGAGSIIVPADGLELRGLGLNVSVLKSSGVGHIMFADASGDSGGLSMGDMTLTSTGASSKIFDLDNSGATAAGLGRVEFNNVNFTDVVNIGDLSNFVQLLQMTCVWRSVDDGYTFHGTWGGALFIDSFLVRGFGSSGVMFREGTGLTFGSRMFCNGNIDVPTGSIAYDFSHSVFNDASFELVFGNYSGGGTVSSIISNADTEARFRDNNGFENTYVGGRWALNADTGTTTTVAGTFYKMAGVTTSADLQWMSGGTANDLTYDSSEKARAIVQGSASIASGTANTNVTLRVVKLDASDSLNPVTLADMPTLSLKSAGDALQIPIVAYADLEAGDVVEVWVTSDKAGAVLTFSENTNSSVTERAN